MHILGAIIVNFFICGILLIELNRRSTAVFLWVGLLLFFGLSHLYNCIIGSVYSDILNEASFFVIFFCMAYLAGRMAFCWISPHPLLLKSSATLYETAEPQSRQKIVNMLFHIFVFSTIAYVVTLIMFAGTLSAISKATVYAFRAGSLFVLTISYLWSISVAVTLYFIVKRERKKVILCFLCIATMSIISFTRTYLIILFVAIIVYLIFSQNKIRLKIIVGIFIVAIFAVYAMYLLRGFRYYYSFADIGNISFTDINNMAFALLATRSGDLYMGNFFYGLLEIENNFLGLGIGSGYLRLLLMPIPSSITFGIKPEDICITLGRLFGSGVAHTAVSYTVTPTLFGDCYANFGFYGFLMGFVWAVIICIMDRLASRKTLLFRCLYTLIISSAYINIARGDVYNAMALIYYATVIYTIIFLFVKLRFNYKSY
ncbi:O-antigen polymerase [Cloacibacillus porcorum]|uniref:O-antigen polymerase n=1 Tax=Cloacibacillus porcorum TaxID=1197717 RepID=UPI0023EF71B8|nr:O-antigen polymerase [Cloacibacillus porcorum]MDD7648001.1 O-antigen ligase [Cloacibacillus porcorum]MDY4093473.1 O-antigen polymerase [Cloacibacillus porcorum]